MSVFNITVQMERIGSTIEVRDIDDLVRKLAQLILVQEMLPNAGKRYQASAYRAIRDLLKQYTKVVG